MTIIKRKRGSLKKMVQFTFSICFCSMHYLSFLFL